MLPVILLGTVWDVTATLSSSYLISIYCITGSILSWLSWSSFVSKFKIEIYSVCPWSWRLNFKYSSKKTKIRTVLVGGVKKGGREWHPILGPLSLWWMSERKSKSCTSRSTTLFKNCINLHYRQQQHTYIRLYRQGWWMHACMHACMHDGYALLHMYMFLKCDSWSLPPRVASLYFKGHGAVDNFCHEHIPRNTAAMQWFQKIVGKRFR